MTVAGFARRKVLGAVLSSTLLLLPAPAGAAPSETAGPRYDAIYSGSPWSDDQGGSVNAHGGQILYDNGRYYWVGERRKDNANTFDGFTLYSSTDLTNWKFEKLVLPVQSGGILGAGRIGERPKIMKSPSTGEYVMFMHTDDAGYTDPRIGYATSPTINGTYTFRGPLLYNGNPIRMWDMGTFQNTDGSGYLLLHEGDIYRLAADYRSAVSKVASNFAPGMESPAVFKAGSTYFWLGSHKTSWERNDNVYYTASSLSGPWTSRGNFAPAGTLTWNSQTTAVLPVKGSAGTTYLFMGDRWAFPLNARATYVWQPLTVSGTSLSLPAYREAWRIDTSAGTWSTVPPSGTTVDDTKFRSRTAGSTFSTRFTGTRIKLYGTVDNNEGYATVAVVDGSNAVVASATIDFYSKYRASDQLKYVSPMLAGGTYTLRVTVSGSHGTWTDKAGHVYGSTDDYVALDRAVAS